MSNRALSIETKVLPPRNTQQNYLQTIPSVSPIYFSILATNISTDLNPPRQMKLQKYLNKRTNEVTHRFGELEPTKQDYKKDLHTEIVNKKNIRSYTVNEDLGFLGYSLARTLKCGSDAGFMKLAFPSLSIYQLQACSCIFSSPH